MKMKKNVTIALTAFLMFAGSFNLNAQQDSSSSKLPFGQWLTKTPWLVSFGGSIIFDDLNKDDLFKNPLRQKYIPAKFTAEKVLKKGWSLEFAFTSTSLQPHNFLAIDLNGKYDLNKKNASKLDLFAVVGLGYTFSNKFPGTNLEINNRHQANFNAGLAGNYWLFPNMGITAQGIGKIGPNNHLQASLGLVFKIGNCAAPKCEATPKTQEAQDALQHLRGIINK